MLRNAFNSSSPLSLQALKDEVCFLYLSNETYAQSKFVVKNKKVYFKSSKFKVSQGLKSDLDAKTKLQIALEGKVPEDCIETIKQKVVAEREYLSLKSLMPTVKSIYDVYAGAR